MEEKLEGPLEVQPAGSLLFKKKPVTKFFTYEQGYFTCYTTRRDWQLGNPELTLDLARDVQSVEHKAGGRAFAVDCKESASAKSMVLKASTEPACQMWVRVLKAAMSDAKSQLKYTGQVYCRRGSQHAYEEQQEDNTDWSTRLVTERFLIAANLEEDDRSGWISDRLNELLEGSASERAAAMRRTPVERACRGAHRVMADIEGLVADFDAEQENAQHCADLSPPARARLERFCHAWTTESQRIMLSRLLLELQPHMGVDAPRGGGGGGGAAAAWRDAAALLSVAARVETIVRAVTPIAEGERVDIRAHLQDAGALTAAAVSAAAAEVEQRWSAAVAALCRGDADARASLAEPLIGTLEEGLRCLEGAPGVDTSALQSLATNCSLVFLGLMSAAAAQPPPLSEPPSGGSADAACLHIAAAAAAAARDIEAFSIRRAEYVDRGIAQEMGGACAACARACAVAVAEAFWRAGAAASMGEALFSGAWRTGEVTAALLDAVAQWRNAQPAALPGTVRGAMDGVVALRLVLLYVAALIAQAGHGGKRALGGDRGLDAVALEQVRKDCAVIEMDVRHWQEVSAASRTTPKLNGALQLLRWTECFMAAPPPELLDAFAEAAVALSAAAAGAAALHLRLYDHLRTCLKLRGSAGVSTAARREALAAAAECIRQLEQQQQQAAPRAKSPAAQAAAAATGALESLYPHAGQQHATGKRWALESAADAAATRLAAIAAIKRATAAVAAAAATAAAAAAAAAAAEAAHEEESPPTARGDASMLSSAVTVVPVHRHARGGSGGGTETYRDRGDRDLDAELAALDDYRDEDDNSASGGRGSSGGSGGAAAGRNGFGGSLRRFSRGGSSSGGGGNAAGNGGAGGSVRGCHRVGSSSRGGGSGAVGGTIAAGSSGGTGSSGAAGGAGGRGGAAADDNERDLDAELAALGEFGNDNDDTAAAAAAQHDGYGSSVTAADATLRRSPLASDRNVAAAAASWSAAAAWPSLREPRMRSSGASFATASADSSYHSAAGVDSGVSVDETVAAAPVRRASASGSKRSFAGGLWGGGAAAAAAQQRAARALRLGALPMVRVVEMPLASPS